MSLTPRVKLCFVVVRNFSTRGNSTLDRILLSASHEIAGKDHSRRALHSKTQMSLKVAGRCAVRGETENLPKVAARCMVSCKTGKNDIIAKYAVDQDNDISPRVAR
jgi:hypothetical protein